MSSTRLFLNFFMSFLILCRLPKSLSISAAPSFLPFPPSSSPPSLSPDISPLFPSTGGSELAPTEPSLPTIPSSPSPPNPDDAMAAPGPLMLALSPLGSSQVSSSVALQAPVMGFFVMAFWIIHSGISGVYKGSNFV